MSNNDIPQNPQLFLDELGEDFDVSLSNLCLGNDTNGALIRDLNQVISTLSDSVKVESIEREDIATDFTDSRVIQRTPLTPERFLFLFSKLSFFIIFIFAILISI
jgi:hypothetical protein